MPHNNAKKTLAEAYTLFVLSALFKPLTLSRGPIKQGILSEPKREPFFSRFFYLPFLLPYKIDDKLTIFLPPGE